MQSLLDGYLLSATLTMMYRDLPLYPLKAKTPLGKTIGAVKMLGTWLPIGKWQLEALLATYNTNEQQIVVRAPAALSRTNGKGIPASAKSESIRHRRSDVRTEQVRKYLMDVAYTRSCP